MNERIRQLWEDNDTIEVCYPEQGSPVSVSATTLEKFAELIVKEMLRLLEQYSRDSFPEDIIDDFDKGYLGGLYTAQEAVKKHFGVEL